MGEIISEAKVRQNVVEYLERMRKRYKTGIAVLADKQIDCPACGKSRGLVCKLYVRNNYRWVCVWLDCNYELPHDFSPPSPEELERFLADDAWIQRRIIQIKDFCAQISLNAREINAPDEGSAQNHAISIPESFQRFADDFCRERKYGNAFDAVWNGGDRNDESD